MMDLKQISADAIPRALELGERYRLLNEPDQAASICRDILTIDVDNQEALRMLLLALTDQFGRRRGASLSDCEQVLRQLNGEYEQAYYAGVTYERWGRSKLQEGTPGHVVGEWLARAMDCYQRAEAHRPVGNDDALLRWNTCVRLMQRTPELRAESVAHEMHFGD